MSSQHAEHAPGEWAVSWGRSWGLRGRWIYVTAPCPGAVRVTELPPGAKVLGWPVVGIPADSMGGGR